MVLKDRDEDTEELRSEGADCCDSWMRELQDYEEAPERTGVKIHEEVNF